MYAKTKPAVWSILSVFLFFGVFLGSLVLFGNHDLSSKNRLISWGLATMDAGDGFVTFGDGKPAHVTWLPATALLFAALVPASAVYAILASRKSVDEVDMMAASNPYVAPPAPATPAAHQQGYAPPMGYPMPTGYGPPAAPQVPPHMLGGIPANPGGG